MARKTRRPRWQNRSAEPSPTVASRTLVNPADPRQADLFAPGAFIPPMLATLADRVPAGPLWQYEIEHERYRLRAHLGVGAVRLEQVNLGRQSATPADVGHVSSRWQRSETKFASGLDCGFHLLKLCSAANGITGIG